MTPAPALERSSPPVLTLVPSPPAQQTFVAARQAMLRAWSILLATNVDAELLDEEITCTANAMRQLQALANV